MSLVPGLERLCPVGTYRERCERLSCTSDRRQLCLYLKSFRHPLLKIPSRYLLFYNCDNARTDQHGQIIEMRRLVMILQPTPPFYWCIN
jgi:hypothetical protein